MKKLTNKLYDLKMFPKKEDIVFTPKKSAFIGISFVFMIGFISLMAMSWFFAYHVTHIKPWNETCASILSSEEEKESIETNIKDIRDLESYYNKTQEWLNSNFSVSSISNAIFSSVPKNITLNEALLRGTNPSKFVLKMVYSSWGKENNAKFIISLEHSLKGLNLAMDITSSYSNSNTEFVLEAVIEEIDYA